MSDPNNQRPASEGGSLPAVPDTGDLLPQSSSTLRADSRNRLAVKAKTLKWAHSFDQWQMGMSDIPELRGLTAEDASAKVMAAYALMKQRNLEKAYRSLNGGGRGFVIAIALLVGLPVLWVVGIPTMLYLGIDPRPIRQYLWLVIFPFLLVLAFLGKARRQQQLRPYILEVLAKEKVAPTPVKNGDS